MAVKISNGVTIGVLASSSGTVTSIGIIPGPGISVADSPVTTAGNITVTNTGVTSLIGGTNISVSSATGDVTVGLTGLIPETQIAPGSLLARNADNESITGSWIFNTNTVVPLVPTADGHATSKSYVDNLITGLTWKQSVRVATTANLPALSGLLTIDGVTVIAGDRVLVKNQSTNTLNGIYVAAATAWTRATDADTPAEINGAAVFIREGTTLAQSAWTQTQAVTTIGTSPIVFVVFSASGGSVARTGDIMTGRLNISTGTNGTPLRLLTDGSFGLSVPFESGSNTGYVGFGNIFSNSVASDFGIRSDNALLFASGSGGILRMKIDFDGNVGIGTPSPTPGTSARSLSIRGTNSATVDFRRGAIGSEIASGKITAQLNNLLIDSVEFKPIVFNTSGAEKMRIEGNGLVGIGTNSPGALLDVRGTIRSLADGGSEGNFRLVNASGTTGAKISVGTGASSGMALATDAGPIIFSTNDVEKMWIDPTGNVGIGVTPNTARFTVYGGTLSNNTGLSFSANPGAGRLVPAGTDLHSIHTYLDASVVEISAASSPGNVSGIVMSGLQAAAPGVPGTVRFFTGSQERMRIDENGAVLVNNRIFVGNSATHGIALNSGWQWIGHATGTPDPEPYMFFYYNNNEAGSIRQGGGGNTVSYNTTSDYRLKNIEGDVDNSGAFIDGLRPRRGTWKSSGVRFVGFVAHEFAEVVPQAVIGEKDAVDDDGAVKPQSMSYSDPELIANIVAELKSLRARLAAAGL